jgi:hypothetical protein
MATFYEPKIWVETHGLDTPPFEQYSGCPSCGGAFTKIYKCECCDEWITGPYIKLNSGERICEECYTTYDLGEE